LKKSDLQIHCFFIFLPKFKKLKFRSRKIISYLLLFLFLQYFGSVTLFLHTHQFRGVQITHSHPFGGSTSKPNQHTENEFMLIQILSDFVITFTFILLVIEFLKISQKVVFNKKIKVITPKQVIICFNGLRSPPKAVIPVYN
jgi:hypothetical protein